MQVALRDPAKMISWILVADFVYVPVITAAPSALLVLFLTSLFVVLEVCAYGLRAPTRLL